MFLAYRSYLNIRKFDISNDDTNLVMRATAASRNINQQRMFLLCPILLHMFVGVICAVCDNYFFTWVASLSGKTSILFLALVGTRPHKRLYRLSYLNNGVDFLVYNYYHVVLFLVTASSPVCVFRELHCFFKKLVDFNEVIL